MFEEKVKPFDQCQIMSSWRLCVYNIYMCVCAYTHKDVPSQTPQKNLGMLPQVQEKMYFHSHPVPKFVHSGWGRSKRQQQ
jgi:hypothetical protein